MTDTETGLPHFKHRLATDLRPSGRTQVSAPFDGEPIAEVDMFGEDGVEAALASARALYDDRAGWLSADQRMGISNKTAALLAERAETFALGAAREGGKPLLDSRVEVARAVDGLRNCAELLRSESGVEIPMGVTPASRQRFAFTTHEPIGPVVVVSVFNHPLSLIVHQIGPAITAGCPVVVKPAEAAPSGCMFLVDLLREAGLPDAWAQALLTNSHATSEHLITDPRVAFFSFIGGPRVGWMLRSKLSPGTRCALEHGGAAPVIVEKDADLERLIPALAKAGFYHAGQVCVSVQRVFAHKWAGRRPRPAGGGRKRREPCADFYKDGNISVFLAPQLLEDTV
jgi:acyl-CoA reductase-like NAD-dependent aldehyde dehydrogenase